MNLPLPKDTRDYFGNEKERLLKISNIGLLFSKYFYCWPPNWQSNETHNIVFRKDIEDIISKQKDNDYIRFLTIRQKTARESLQSSGRHVLSFEAVTDSRLIIGLGGTSVIETGMTLHPLYGFPYLPGSGLKGVARAYAEIWADATKEELMEVFGSEDKDPRHATNNRQDKVFFMDGLPIQFPKLELDIMNPHYSDYYQGNKPPADYLHPVPVTFLTVAAEQPFSFAVLSKDKGFAEKAKQWLIGGLTDLGAGGKTNVGYGYFRIAEQQQTVVTGKNTCVVDETKTASAQEDTSLTARLKAVKNADTFSAFVKQLVPEDMEAFSCISFAEKKSVINIGLAPTLESLEIVPKIKQAVALKMLDVCSKPDAKYTEKLEKYNRLLLLAGRYLEN